jgi:predicted nucleic acid-binding Zn ribbon protein
MILLPKPAVKNKRAIGVGILVQRCVHHVCRIRPAAEPSGAGGPFRFCAPTRAGQTCPVCAKAITTQRSTRRYCSDSCRVKAHRSSGTRRKMAELRPGQICVLSGQVGKPTLLTGDARHGPVALVGVAVPHAPSHHQQCGKPIYQRNTINPMPKPAVAQTIHVAHSGSTDSSGSKASATIANQSPVTSKMHMPAVRSELR